MIMKRYNLLIGLGLLSAASLSSCKEEVFDKNNNTFYGEELKLYTAEAGLETFETNDAGKSSRANVESDGKSFLWNTGDAVSIWDGATGNFKFTASEDYNAEVNPQNKIAFAGNAALTDGAKVWGVYPYTEVEGTFTDKNVKLTLPETVTILETNKPALQKTMFMIAEGEVAGDKIEKLNFKHLTGIFQFNITNTESEAKTFSSVSIKASTPIFPTVVTGTLGDDNQMSYAYTEEKDVLSGQFGEITLEEGQSVSVYMNFLPTQLSDETELTFSVGNTEVLKGTVAELYNSSSSIISAGYEAGKRYIINLKTEERYPDEGYRQEGDNYIVYDAKGLKAVLANSEAITAGKTIKLNRGIDFKGAELTPVENFAATLDGNDNFISNYTISNSGSQGDYALFINNSGIIKNLVIKDITLNDAKVATSEKNVSSFVGVNTGSIIGCTFDNIQLTLPATSSKARLGVVTGTNSGDITDVNVLNSQINVNQWCDAGTISGVNYKNITNCYADATVSLDNPDPVNGAANFGGIVGWASGGNIYASGTHLTLTIIKGAKVGGVVGANGGNIELTYSTGSITGGSSKAGFICTAAQNNKVKKSYTTIADLKFCNVYAGTFENCYTSSAASETQLGITTTTVDQIKEGLKDQSVTIGGATYQFVENTGSDSSTRPLIIEKQ